jgi:hypothetical protein
MKSRFQEVLYRPFIPALRGMFMIICIFLKILFFMDIWFFALYLLSSNFWFRIEARITIRTIVSDRVAESVISHHLLTCSGYANTSLPAIPGRGSSCLSCRL